MVCSEKIRTRVGAAVDTLFVQVEAGTRAAEQAVLDWLRTTEGLDLAADLRANVSGGSDWAPKPIERPGYASYAGSVFTGLRGGQGGIFTIGMVAGLAGITLTTAATAGIGLVFGGKQILDERRRQLQARRQQARTNAKQFVDDLQFESTKRLRDFSRDLQRQLRDGFLALVAERQRTCAESLAAVQAAVQQGATERAANITALRERVEQLRLLDARAAELEEGL